MRRLLVLGAISLLVIAACGDDDGANDALVDDLAAQIQSDSAPGDVPFSTEDAACFATGLIDEFGGERMVDALDQEFEEFMAAASSAERRRVVDIMLDCADFGAVLTAEFSTGLSAESSQCLSDAFVGSETFRDALAESFGSTGSDPFDDSELMGELLPVMLECVTAEELIQLGENG